MPPKPPLRELTPREQALNQRSKKLLQQMEQASHELASIRRELEKSTVPDKPSRRTRMPM